MYRGSAFGKISLSFEVTCGGLWLLSCTIRDMSVLMVAALAGSLDLLMANFSGGAELENVMTVHANKAIGEHITQ